MFDLENPYFSAGFGLAVIAAASTGLRRASIITVNYARKRIICTLEVRSQDPAYPWVLKFLSNPKLLQPSASKYLTRFKPPAPDNLSVATIFKQHENGSIETSFNLNPGIGRYWIVYKGAWMSVERTREKSTNITLNAPWESISISTLAMDKGLFDQFLLEAREEEFRAIEGKTVIYTSYGPEWRPFGRPRRKRPLKSVVLDQGISSMILKDISQFMASSSWYHDRGIPWRRGYLLYGPPGSGKTSYIQALAGNLDYNICVMNLSERGMTDDRLAHLLINVPPKSIILLEDVDAAFPSRDKTPGNQSGLLNALDGVASTEERLIFMTTNYAELLDKALTRPGRVDVKILIGDASDYQVLQLFVKFYNDEVLAQKFLKILRMRSSTVSCAQLQGHFVAFKDDPEAAIECIADL